MLRKSLLLALFIAFSVGAMLSQDHSRYNFDIGGGPGWPVKTTGDFSNVGGNFVIGAGPNFGRFLGVNVEYMYHSLPIKSEVIRILGVPDASARQHSVTINAIVNIPTASKLGFYAIGGGGWYHRSGELTAPTFVAGTVCPGFWVWWGSCVNGLFPANAVLRSSSSDAFGGNIGGGITWRLGETHAKFYTEARYHHAAHDPATDLVPLTFGLRW